MQASILTATGHPTAHFQVGPFERPKISAPNEILIKVAYAAANPVDYKMAQFNFAIPTLPFVIGCDASGTVEQVGDNVKNLKVGDKVFAYCNMGVPGRGAFAEYLVHDADFVTKVPSAWSLSQAASAYVGILTAGVSLYYGLKLRLPSKAVKEDEFVLVWGGSSSVGHYTVQLAALSGYRVIATASAANAENVRALGAEFVVDYRDGDAVNKIIEYSQGRLRYAIDTVGPETEALCAKALKHPNAVLALVGAAPGLRSSSSDVTTVKINAGAPEVAEFQKSFFNDEVTPLLNAGKIRPQPLKIFEGLESVPAALEAVKDNKLGGAKAIIRVAGDA